MRDILIIIIITLALSSLINAGYSQDLTAAKTQVVHRDTDVVVTRDVEVAGTSPILLKYKIVTPKVDDFDFVLALDSSGSFGVGGDPYSTQKTAVLGAIPQFIENIRNNSEYSNNNFKISIIGWNDKIDFAYGGFDNKIPSKAKLVPLENITKEIDKLKDHYECDEETFTNISIPISAALNILDEKNNPLNPNKRTSRFVILVTGRSEFTKAEERLINEVRKKNYPIYIIGLDVVKGSKLHDHLMELGDDKLNRIKFIRFIPSESDLLAEELFNALNAHLLNATREPIARNVVIDETVYPYVEPDLKSIQIQGNALGANSYIRKNADNTNTVHLELANGLMPKTVTEITLKANLKINLPVTVSGNPKPIQKQEYQSHPSIISMNWLNEMQPKETILPSNTVNLQSTPLRVMDSSSQSDVHSSSLIPRTGVLLSLLRSLNLPISVMGAIGLG